MKTNRILSFILITLLTVALPLSAQTKSKSTATAPAPAAKSAPAAKTTVEHFSMYTGQIILLAKTFKGDLGFYDLSGEPRPTWKGGAFGH